MRMSLYGSSDWVVTVFEEGMELLPILGTTSGLTEPAQNEIQLNVRPMYE